MELPFEKTVCRYWKQKLYTLLKTEETQELKIPESMPEVGRIISSWSQVILRGKEWRDRQAVINGGIMLWVLYAPEDGGALQHLESWVPFQLRTDLPEDGPDGVIRVEAFSGGVDARAVSSRRILVRAGANLLVQALEPEELEVSVPGQFPEDLELKQENYPFRLTREAGEKTFLMDEEVNLPAGMPKPEQLVYYQLSPEILEQKVLGSKAAFRGIGNLHVLFVDTEGRLTGTDCQIPFAQYVDLDGEYESEAQVSCQLCVTSMELDILPDGALHLKCGLVSQHTIQSVETLTLLSDCYSPCRDVETERQLISVPAWLDHQHRSVSIQSSLPAEGKACVDLTFYATAPAIAKRGSAVEVELGGTFQAVTMDGDGAYASVQQKTLENIRMESECETVCFNHRQGNPTCRAEGGSWRTDTRLMVDLNSLCARPMELVTGITVGEIGRPDPERPSVIIRSRRGCESLWELAKRCGSTVGAIRRMNKLEGEPEEDRLLLIPVI